MRIAVILDLNCTKGGKKLTYDCDIIYKNSVNTRKNGTATGNRLPDGPVSRAGHSSTVRRRIMERYLEVNNISKSFPGVKALQNISFRAESGTVTALLGENGAGKSTLLKVLSGVLKPDEGTVVISGKEVKVQDTHSAFEAGISIIYQERQLIPMMSVAENIFLDDSPEKKFGFVDRRTLRAETQKLLDKFQLPFGPDELVGRLPVAYQQMVEIMKAYRRDADIIAFDEPTAPLTEKEIRILFSIIEELKQQGKVILYVSHRMNEIFEITDRIVIFKDGQMVDVVNTAETTEAALIRAMVGRDIGDTYNKLDRNTVIGEVILEAKGLTNDVISDVSFQLHRGEVLGFAGLVGAGRTETVRAVFGADRITSGEILIHGEPVKITSPKEAIASRIALCPEDRKEQGLILKQTIRSNISMPVLSKIKNGLLLSRKKEKALADEAVEKYDIRTPSIDKIAGELSGGNQQKVILGRWTSSLIDMDILILDEPTKGIDVGAKSEIYQTICNLAKEGKGVILISSELTEVINLSDRIIVMHNGHVTGTMTREEATEENVLALAMQD